MATNTQVRLASRPSGLPQDSNWEITSEDVPTPGDGELLVRVLYLSLDPAMRGWMNEGRSYIPPVGIGEVMRAGAVGVVEASNNAKFSVGDHVSGTFGVQEYAVSDGSGVVKVDISAASLPTYLGTLGMPGLTAYFGLLEVGALKDGETVVVSGAAGAVGTVVGQIAKIKGCTVIGIAGGAEKCRWLVEELGFDAAIDYKNDDVRKGLKQHAPKGVDVYFDNVGGEILDAVLGRLAMGARIAICGAISQYNAQGELRGPSNYMNLLVFRARMQGFVVFDFASRYSEGVEQMAAWMSEGKLAAHEDVAEGTVKDFPATLLRLFRGENLGKLVLKVAAE
jgi:NADPH-dependent curcumin reductase CurA